MAAECVWITVILFGFYRMGACTVSEPSDITSCNTTGDITIPWSYSNSANMSSVFWEFEGNTIMYQVSGNSALPQGGFNVVHISNGAMKITSPTAANSGTYRITVTYFSFPDAVSDVEVDVNYPPTGLNFTTTTNGEQITVTCSASSLGGPIPATLYIEVDSEEIIAVSPSAVVIINKKTVKCCVRGKAADCLDESKRCVTALKCIAIKCIIWKILCSIGVALKIVCIIFPVVLIILGPQGKTVNWRLTRCDIAVIAVDFVAFLYSLIVGAIGVAKNPECNSCSKSGTDECETCLALCGTSIALSCVDLIVLIFFIVIRQVSDKRKKQSNDGVKDGASDQEMMGHRNKTSL